MKKHTERMQTSSDLWAGLLLGGLQWMQTEGSALVAGTLRVKICCASGLGEGKENSKRKKAIELKEPDYLWQ